jgi:putative membrane protein
VSDPGTPQRTDPRGILVGALTSVVRGALPAGAILLSTSGIGALVTIAAVAGVAAFSLFFAWLAWSRRTYTTDAEDIRVEWGLFARYARSVPYERIQDVSIEQKWLPRLFGLAQVKFETGAGGKEEVSLAYLTLPESERLRELVRERKEGVAAAVPAETIQADIAAAPSDLLFAMDTKRLALFGLFEFSLIVFAVILGAADQLDFLLPFDFWDWDTWRAWLGAGGDRIAGISRTAQIAGFVGALVVLIGLGLLTGVARTFARDYGFRLERTAKGFRRRRGLFNKSDVLLPAHRVQAALVRTGLIRRRFGWHGLEFVSLAQDGAKTPHHSAAPFARLDEIWPVVRAAGIEPPATDANWRRPSPRPWLYDTVLHSLFFSAIAVAVALGWDHPLPLAVGAVFVLGTIVINWLGWRRARHALDATQVFHRKGTLAPHLTIAPRVKLQSAEIVQSPLGRWRGYATLKLGLAGGRLDLVGLPVEEARAVRRAVLDSIAEVDFSKLAEAA